MSNELHMEPETYWLVVEHLRDSGTEQVAFAFSDVATTEDGVSLHVNEVYLVPPDEIHFQFGYHISLTDDGLARVIKMAWDRKAALVDLHSHISDLHPAQFSPTDLFGFRDWVPHIWWRLKGKPVIAAVVSPSGFDALVWRLSPDDPEALSALHIGDKVKVPTGRTLQGIRGIHGRHQV